MAKYLLVVVRRGSAHDTAIISEVRHATLCGPRRPRRATNLTLPEALLRDARELGINLSQACERGLAAAVADKRRQRWLDANQGAMDAWNDYVGKHGLPLAAFRQF